MSTVWQTNIGIAQEYIPPVEMENLTLGLEAENLKLKSEIEKQSKIIDISKKLTSEMDVDSLLSLIMASVTELAEADRSTLFFIDTEKGELYSKIAQGVEEIRISIDVGIAGCVARTGQTLNIADAHRDSQHYGKVDKKTGYRTKSILCMPIQNMHGERIAVIQVLNKQTAEVFTEEDEELLGALLPQIGIAIENARLYDSLEESYRETIKALVNTLDARDVETREHSSRVVEYTLEIAREIGIAEKELDAIKYGAMLHDLGKIGVKDAILHKPGPLTPDEWEEMRQHSRKGYEMLQDVKRLKDALPIILHHHERYDGAGYPGGLAKEAIPIGARIFAIADTLDAMTSSRPYRAALPDEVAYEEIVKNSGTQFDPQVVEVFTSIPLERWQAIRQAVSLKFEQNEVDI